MMSKPKSTQLSSSKNIDKKIQRRNSSSAITTTLVDYETISISTSSTSSTSTTILSSPIHHRISRIPVIINNSPRPIVRRSLSLRLRTTTHHNNSELFTSPPSGRRRRISTSVSRENSRVGQKYNEIQQQYNDNINQLKETEQGYLKEDNIKYTENETIEANEKNTYNIEFSQRKDIDMMNTSTDEVTLPPIIDNMASNLEAMKVTDEISSNDLVDCSMSNKNIKMDKIIPNGNCIVDKNSFIDNNCVISNGPISPIAEEEESAGSVGVNILPPGCGTKSKRDILGMTLNLNGPLTSTANSATGNCSKVRTPATPKTPHTPKTPSRVSSSSVTPRRITPSTPPVTPDSYNTYIDDDLDSLYSYSSGRSTMSCDHPYVARNGTTFSGRKMKYVVHCSSHAGQVGEDYLTPTQRAQRQLRRLKELLTQARLDLEQKDSELLRLTREVVELRLFKASLSSPEDPSNSSDAVTVREAPNDLKTSQDVSPIVDTMIDESVSGIKSSPRHLLHGHHSAGGCSSSSQYHHHNHPNNYLDKISNSEMQSSFADSGHFEDMTTSHSTQDRACGSDNIVSTYEEQRAELIRLYEKKIEELIKTQDSATGDMKQSHNDRVEALLQKLADINTRYADIVPDYEQAKEKIRELEKQLEDLQQKLLEHEETQKKMYLHMYQKGQQDERIARADQIMELAHRTPNRVSIPELLHQLQSTQDELENIRQHSSNTNTTLQMNNVSNSRETGECALLTAKEAISLWVLGARKTIYRRLIDAQQNKQKVDPEVTLQFLKSAVYYFLTDKENSQGHLNAIESILEFSEQEKQTINKARASK